MYAKPHFIRDAIVVLVVLTLVAAAWIAIDYGAAAVMALALFALLALGIPFRVIYADVFRDLHQRRPHRR